jgi:hypothetical protein
MPLIQIIIVAFALYALSRAALRLRSGELHLGQVVLWSLFWIGVIVVAVMPQTTSWLASFVGVGRGADLVIYCSIIALFYAMFRLFVRIERMERHITGLVRQIGLRDADLGKELPKRDAA